MRVLVVDDDDITLEIISSALRNRGHEVTTASNGHEALDVLKKGAHRIVISDWEMPEMNGTELCSVIRSSDFGGYVYAILLTSRNQSGDAIAGLIAGADDYLVKPVDPNQLEARIRIAERILSFQTRDVTVFALAKLAEARDTDTGTHLERVRCYSRILARHLFATGSTNLNLPADYAQLIYLTSPLHDIGKVAIPDHVLLKPGRLSDREFEIMKSHTTLGAETLHAALKEHPEASFLQMAMDIALTHHERWDGTGYPNGIKGEAIPLCGRLVALADVYDAMTSKRVYKGAFTHDVAKAAIIGDSGTHFDPMIVDAFIANEAAFLEVHDRYNSSKLAAAA